MTIAKTSHRFKPGNTLGKGRPPGMKNKGTSIRAIIGDEKSNQIIRDLANDAINGDMAARRMLFDKLVALPRPSTFIDADHARDVVTQTDANNALTRILNDVSDANLSLEDADQLMTLIQKKIEATQLCIQEKLDEMQDKVERLTASDV